MIAARDGICKVNRFRSLILFLTAISVMVTDGNKSGCRKYDGIHGIVRGDS